jgi:hypothetical protein
MRTPLERLAQAVGAEAGEQHTVALPLRTRQVTVLLAGLTVEEFRQGIALLYPDAEWVRVGRGWRLQEKANAALIRQLAARYAARQQSLKDEYSRTKEALIEQMVGDLTPEQLAGLERAGELSVGWGSLGPLARDLLGQYIGIFQGIVSFSGGDVSNFADPSRTDALKITLQLRPDGSLRTEFEGVTAGGTRVVWP